MTLTKYGPKYKKWSNKELIDVVRARNVDVPINRGLWVKALRASDRKATFRFLDLPAEIRNLVYIYLLTLTSEGYGFRRTRFICHPQILASCKQINAEASDLLHCSTRIPLSVGLRIISAIPPAPASPRVERVVYAVFNGRDIATVNSNDHTTSLAWPSCLAKFRSIDMDLLLIPGSLDLSGKAAAIRFNNALQQLYLLLSNTGRLSELKLIVSSTSVNECNREYNILSPLCALSANVDKVAICSKPLSSGFLLQRIRHAVDALRKIRSYKDEAMQHMISTSTSIRGVRAASNALDRCKQSFTVVCETGVFRYKSAYELNEMVGVIEADLKEMREADFE